jgi:DNA-binding PadR family transcriptional regulator
MPDVKQIAPRPNQSKFVLLGLLQSAEGSGYDLRKRIDGSIRYFWRESWGQIYPTLKVLERDGLVTVRVEPGQKKPSRRVYAITEQGLSALEVWLAQPLQKEVPRIELLLKLFFGRRNAMEQNLALLEERKSTFEETLSEYQRICGAIEQHCRHDPDAPYWLLTVKHGIAHAHVEIEWCRDSIEALKALPEARPSSM